MFAIGLRAAQACGLGSAINYKKYNYINIVK